MKDGGGGILVSYSERILFRALEGSTFGGPKLSVLAHFGAEVFVKGPCRSLVVRVAIPSRLALRTLLEILTPRGRSAVSTPGNISAVVPSVLRPLSHDLEPIVMRGASNPLR